MISFEKSFDVLVCGGGVAGVAAALEAARSGLKTALVEKTIMPGGLATSGMINIYLPLCDGRGRQVTFGIAEELIHLSHRYGPGDVPRWQARGGAKPAGRFQVIFSPGAFVLALDEALVGAGVEIWFDTLVCSAVMEGDTIRGVEVENKSGRGLLRARCVIDATGDADVALRAGAECAVTDNAMAIWAVGCALDAERPNALDSHRPGRIEMVRFGNHGCRPDSDESGIWLGTDAQKVTRFVLEGRRLLREHYQRLQAQDASKRNREFPLALPSMSQFRTTRRIVGRATLSDGQDGQRVADSVGLVADWRRPGPVWEIPYGALVPAKVRGLLAAGRCISSEGDAWEITRVIPAAALTGQVCGIAAALSIQRGCSPSDLQADPIQRRLSERGIPFHLPAQ